MNDPLREYFDGLKDAPVPVRLLAETPLEALVRRLKANAAWAVAGVVLALMVSSIPVRANEKSAVEVAARFGAGMGMAEAQP